MYHLQTENIFSDLHTPYGIGRSIKSCVTETDGHRESTVKDVPSEDGSLMLL